MSEAESISPQQGSSEANASRVNPSVGSLPVPTGGISRPVFMPAVFTGVGREWSDWVEQFELAANVNGWDDPVKLKFMSLLLSGHARDMFNGVSGEAKSNYALLKAAMSRCLDPCHGDDWNRVAFTERRRLPNETAQEFGNALRRLVIKAYPSVDDHTRDLLARDQFITHFTAGDFRISLRAAKPKTLEAAIHLAAEMELLRALEQTHIVPDAKVRGVAEGPSKTEERFEALLGAVEGLRQEVKTMQTAMQVLQQPPGAAIPLNPSRPPRNFDVSPGAVPNVPSRRRVSRQAGVCWECGCDRHLRRDCPYAQGN